MTLERAVGLTGMAASARTTSPLPPNCSDSLFCTQQPQGSLESQRQTCPHPISGKTPHLHQEDRIQGASVSRCPPRSSPATRASLLLQKHCCLGALAPAAVPSPSIHGRQHRGLAPTPSGLCTVGDAERGALPGRGVPQERQGRRSQAQRGGLLELTHSQARQGVQPPRCDGARGRSPPAGQL